jgi:hypothetical protein
MRDSGQLRSTENVVSSRRIEWLKTVGREQLCSKDAFHIVYVVSLMLYSVCCSLHIRMGHKGKRFEARLW